MEQLIKVANNSYRAKFSNEKDMMQWVMRYEEESCTSWRIKQNVKNSSRFISRYVIYNYSYMLSNNNS